MDQHQKHDSQSHPKGVVALLQEFVQCSQQFAAPQHRPILQWAYEQRVIGLPALEFRGIVAFLLDGVPHHVAGGWHPSKKLAQRDAAERALTFFVGKWGEQLLDEQAVPVRAPRAGSGASDTQVLDEFCRSYPPCGGSAPQWSHTCNGHECSAQVQILLLGVPHKFAGAGKPTEEAAYADVARRVLWYFQCPGYQHRFAPDPRAEAVTAKEIPSPPANWACDSAEIADLQKAERKTALMRVQNKLQQEFAKQLKPGQSVWEWSYDMDETDTAWPPLCQARVTVPVLGQTFVGDWVRGQRDAQIQASYRVAEFLDGNGRDCIAQDTRAPSSGTGSEWGSEEFDERIKRWADIDVLDE